MQLGVLRHARLDKQRRLRRINAGGKPIDHHAPCILFDDFRSMVVGCQSVPVGDEKKAFEFMLQLEPVLEHAVIMAQMQRTRRAHAG